MNHVYVKPSSGLVAFAAAQAVVFLIAIVTVLHIPHPSTCDPGKCVDSGCCDQDQLIPTPRRIPTGSAIGSFTETGKLESTPRVPAPNSAALNEMKQQTNCLPCQLQPQVPAANRPQITKNPAKTAQVRYELALFLDGSAKSRQLQEWFHTNQDLVELRSRCDYQEYTLQSPLYRTRFAAIIPPDQFPAVLFLKPDGGHVHAAGGNMIPGSASALVSDLVEGYRLSKSVESAESSGAIKETGYKWSAEIKPEMTLEQCGPDGCTPDGGGFLSRPRDRLQDFMDGQASKSAVLWASPIEYAVLAFICIVVVLVIAVAMRKMAD